MQVVVGVPVYRTAPLLGLTLRLLVRLLSLVLLGLVLPSLVLLGFAVRLFSERWGGAVFDVGGAGE
ncbi:hypothetical protein [Actinopolymorpha singaporensis]|uniref:hypothetical protein n=1 Tax=Actinopolymorpha singaporensis TaxID=117157 RepID=UPI000B82C6FE|nr:hypothetical protein [Actinopolymorpha singaporensis]